MSSFLFAQNLTIAAAADLSPLQSQLSSLSPTPTTWTFASSGLLARQIAAGAPYDLYLSANTDFVDDLNRQGLLLPGSIRLYATGRLALWSPNARLRSLQDLLQPSVLHIAIPNPQHAPYGKAAEQALRKLNLWDRLQPKLVYAENVRQAWEFARTGNADAVLTSWTLLHDQGGILVPDTLHAPLRQAGAVVKASPNARAAQAFLDALVSPKGRQILAAEGLTPAKP